MKRGFTLVEIVIGLTLFAVVMSAANVLLYTTLRGARKAAATGDTKSEGAYAMNSIVAMTRYARSLTCPVSAPAGSVLQVTRLNGDVITYRLDTAFDPDQLASESAGRRVDLTTNRVNVQTTGCASNGNRIFRCLDARTVSICFRVTDIRGIDGSDTESVNFNSSVTLRNIGN